MKKYLLAIAVAVFAVTNVFAGNDDDDKTPGGWDFEVPGLKVSKSTDLLNGNGSVTVTDGDFVFDIYTRNTGSYAVKVIKIVN